MTEGRYKAIREAQDNLYAAGHKAQDIIMSLCEVISLEEFNVLKNCLLHYVDCIEQCVKVIYEEADENGTVDLIKSDDSDSQEGDSHE